MDRVRYTLAVTAFVLYAPGLLFWFLIHPIADFWRKLGPAITYLIVGAVLASIGLTAFWARAPLLGADLGTNWGLIIAGVTISAILGGIGLTYSRAGYLRMPVRMGVPELSSSAPQALVQTGLYALVRHPIYSFALVGGLAYALITNYLGTYFLFVAAGPVLYALTAVEERELVSRFGDAYRQYMRSVPRFFPSFRRRIAGR